MPEPMRLPAAFREEPASVRGGRAEPASVRGGRAEPASVRAARVVKVAAAQWGVIDSRQLRDCGVGSSATSRWVASGRLHPRYHGVYAVGHPTLPVEGELTAALLAAGPGAALSHATAAWWWGLVERRPSVIEISVPGRREPVPGIWIHHPRHLDATHHRRLPITTVIQTLLDYAATASVKSMRRALAEADFHDRVDLDDVRQALGRGRPGSTTLRAALDSHQPELARTRSELERRFLAFCRTYDLPAPEVNTKMYGYTVDAVWREQRVAVEVDGLKGHRTPAQLESDHQRDLVLRRNGYIVLRYTWRQVTKRPDEVATDLRRALARGPYQR
jgi:very-short-patch-repair endonuclease